MLDFLSKLGSLSSDLLHNLKKRALNILIALDSLVYVLFTLGVGYPSETFSSAAYRAEKQGKFYGKARPFIDWLFCRLEKDHCRLAYQYAINKFNLPQDMR